MHDTETGEVTLDTVIQVLRAFRVDISTSDDDPKIYGFIRGEIMVSLPLPDWISRKVVHYLSRTFGIHVHYFYNPGMIPQGTQLQ